MRPCSACRIQQFSDSGESARCHIVLFFSGRETDRKVTSAAFSHYTSGEIIIRLKGSIATPGIYRFPKNSRAGTVINMTAPLLVEKIADKRILSKELENGEIIDVVDRDKQHIGIMIYKMKAKERVLLGIPLIPDEMDLADWDSLPGIGPELAKEIMTNRQKYGDFGSFNSLERVPGIGEKRLKALRKYFLAS